LALAHPLYYSKFPIYDQENMFENIHCLGGFGCLGGVVWMPEERCPREGCEWRIVCLQV
jgi:hypothetical protein